MVQVTIRNCAFLGNTIGVATNNDYLVIGKIQVYIDNCIFLRNNTGCSGHGTQGEVSNSTFHQNANAGASYLNYMPSFVRNIFTGTTSGYGIVFYSIPDLTALRSPAPLSRECNVFWDNFLGPCSFEIGPTDVVADPIYCDPSADDFGVSSAGPAAPANSACGELVGARPVGCSLTAVLVEAFHASTTVTGVELSWGIFTDEPVAGFRLIREDIVAGSAIVLPPTGLLGPDARRYADTGVKPGTDYAYTLVVVGEDGDYVRSKTIQVSLPAAPFRLEQNVPNPFNPSTRIVFDLHEDGQTRLVVYDVTGRRIRTLMKGYLTAGAYGTNWNGRNDKDELVSAGVYYYRLRTEAAAITKKMVLIK
jgi:hypothetical protein